MTTPLSQPLLNNAAMSRCMTPSTKQLIGGALLAIIALGLTFLAHYHFSEAWNSIRTVVPLAVASAALTYLAIKVYRQWGVEETSYEVGNFFGTFKAEGSPNFSERTICWYKGEKLSNPGAWLNQNVINGEDREKINKIIEYSLSNGFVIESQEMLRSKNLVAPNNITHSNSYNIRGKEGNWVVEISLQKTVTNLDNEKLKYKLITDIQVDITTQHAIGTTSLIPL